MSFNIPIQPSISFRGFRHRGEENPHGWGIAFYPDNSAQIIKEELRASKSPLAEKLVNYEYVKSKVIISHVRFASLGQKSHKNTHPFSRELNGKEWTFAHNGTLSNYSTLETGRFKPIGETDSEHAFCYLLKCIKDKHITRWANENFRWLLDILKEINEKGKFNCIFSDGEYLFCYYDKNGLYFVKREAPFSTVKLEDEDFEINLSEEKNLEQKGFIIATRPLTDETWKSFNCGELIVFKEGKMIFSSSNRRLDSSQNALGEKEIQILKKLRQSPHKMSLLELGSNPEIPKKELISIINSLRNKGFIKQDSTDKVNWNNEKATYYTESSKRREIDKMINQSIK